MMTPTTARARALRPVDRGEAGRILADLRAQDFVFTAHDLFSVTGANHSARSYARLSEALERLQGTQIKTNIEAVEEAARREAAAQANYRLMGGGSPLLGETQAQARALETALAERLALFAPIFPVVTDWDVLWPLLIGVGLLGVLLGLIGSLFATRRYLRELE